MSTDTFDRNEKFLKGLEIRRKVQGAKFVDESMATAEKDPFMRPMQQLANEYCWGHMWARPGLDLKTRSLLNIAILASLGMSAEIQLHVRGALNNNCTEDEISEVLLQVCVYAGMAAGSSAFRAAKKVLDEERATKTK